MINYFANNDYSGFDQFVQNELIRMLFPVCNSIIYEKKVVVNFEVKDEDFSTVYKLRVEYHSQNSHNVYVLKPLIEPSFYIHMYKDRSLCLYYLPDISPFRRIMVAKDLIPLAFKWVFLYERWIINGHRWEGPESPHHHLLMRDRQNRL